MVNGFINRACFVFFVEWPFYLRCPAAKSQPLMVTKLCCSIPYHPTTATLQKGSQGKPKSDEYIANIQWSGPYCCLALCPKITFGTRGCDFLSSH